MIVDYVQARERMVQEQLVSRGIKDARVLWAMAKVPRHLFVEGELWNQAYDDHPLPIGAGQTISQPYMVALMVEALGLKGTERVLEQVRTPGYLVLPMGEKELQTLVRIRKDGEGIREEYLGECQFVKLRGKYGWED